MTCCEWHVANGMLQLVQKLSNVQQQDSESKAVCKAQDERLTSFVQSSD